MATCQNTNSGSFLISNTAVGSLDLKELKYLGPALFDAFLASYAPFCAMMMDFLGLDEPGVRLLAYVTTSHKMTV